MGLFGFLKKKPKEADIELPPPPRPPEAEAEIPSEEEFPAIRPGMDMEEEAPEFAPEPAEMPGVMPAEAPPEFVQEIQPYEEEHEIPPITAPSFEPEEGPAKVFDRTIREFMPKREEVVRPMEVKPMFVSVDEYKNLASNTKVIRARLVEAEEYVAKLSDLKNQKTKIFDKWRKMLEDTEKKLSYVDAVIEKAQG